MLCRSAFSRHHDDPAASANPSEASEKGMNKHVSVCAGWGALGQLEKRCCAPQMLLPQLFPASDALSLAYSSSELLSLPWLSLLARTQRCEAAFCLSAAFSQPEALCERSHLLLRAHTQIIHVGAHLLFQLPEWELCGTQAPWSQRY